MRYRIETHQHQHRVHEAEGAGAADARAAMHDGRPLAINAFEQMIFPHAVQEIKKRMGRLRHFEVGPSCVVEMPDFPGFFRIMERHPKMFCSLGSVWTNIIYKN